MKKKVLEYAITTLICSVLAFLLAILFGLFKYQEAFRIYAAICDGLFISGVLCLSIGGLIFVHNNGFFDILFYGMFRFVTLFMKKRKHNYETFYDYRVAQAEKPKAEFLFFLVVGLAFVLVSIVFLILWGKASGEF